MRFPVNTFRTLLRERRCVPIGVIRNNEIWVLDEEIVIRFPMAKDIHIDIAESIVIDVLGLSFWEWDYWLGQNPPIE